MENYRGYTNKLLPNAASLEAQNNMLKDKSDFHAYQRKLKLTGNMQGWSKLLQDNTIEIKSEEDITKLSEELKSLKEENDDAIKKRIAFDKAYDNYIKGKAATVYLMTSMFNFPTLSNQMNEQAGEHPSALWNLITKKFLTSGIASLECVKKEFANCMLKNIQQSPDKWFDELEVLTERIKDIDPEEQVSEKALSTHILNNVPKEYQTKVLIIKDKNEYWTDIESIKKGISDFWEENFANVHSTNANNEVGFEEVAAYNVSTNERRYSIPKCNHCGKPGHLEEKCWFKNNNSNHRDSWKVNIHKS